MHARHLDEPVTRLYHDLLDAWNRRDGDAFAALFEDEGTLIGFDGSQMNGKITIAGHLNAIFADHVTAPYTGIVKGVRFLAPDVALLRAIVGMIPIGQSDFDPQLNALQSVVAVRGDGSWRIAHFQTTPAQFHGRHDLVVAMTEELRAALT